jgi:undecaprenyl-diphosphatase
VTALAVFALVLADVLLDGPLRQTDLRGHEWVREHVRGGWHVLAYVLVLAGQRFVVVAPLVVAAIASSVRLRSVRPVVVAASVLVVLAVAVPALKALTGRTAPRSGVDRVFAGGSDFPSGHALNGVVLWGLTFSYVAALGGPFAAWVRRHRRLLTLLTALAAGLGTTGMDYHWWTDVLAGWALGVAVLVAVLALDPVRASPARRAASRSAPSG